ncbi:MAG: leucine-rich repeat domain-containing protein, partial [Tannerella sp.]|nr:leucine-rich repeat domain-containing protein [Tannerella sp.]
EVFVVKGSNLTNEYSVVRSDPNVQSLGDDTQDAVDTRALSITLYVDTYTLVFSGTGAISDYDFSRGIYPSWYEERARIEKIVLGSGVTGIGKDAFRDLTKLTSVSIANTVTSIGATAFANCTRLTAISIPNSVSSLNLSMFDGCTSLANITIASDNSWLSSVNGVIYDKPKATVILCPVGKKGTYAISNGVTTIRSWAFDGCTGLTGITIPSSVKEIQASAFNNCSGLLSFVIPAATTSINISAFDGCSKLFAFSVASGNTEYASEDGVLFNKRKTTLIQFPDGKKGNYTIPGSVTRIENFAFDNALMPSVNIPQSVTEIGNYAFANCTSLLSLYVFWPNPGVVSYGNSIFSGLDATKKGKIKLYVPLSADAVYRSSSIWRDFLTTPTNIEPVGNNPLRLYPSPARESVTVSGLQGGEVISLFDLSGRQQLSLKATDESETIAINHLPTGIYIVRIANANEVHTLKLVVK